LGDTYNPSPQTGSYSTQYTYDDAGNILTLKRRGLVPPLSSPPVYGAIDDLTYNYNDPLNPQEKSRLQSITDAIMDPNAQPEGFKGNQNPGDAIPDKASTFEYDKNGNLIYDGGKELTIDYNLLNLPRLVSHSGSGNSIQLDYTFGGEKIRKVSPEGTRIYLGGVEYLDNSPESLTHSDGRVDFSGAGGPKHQFSIKDHLGNTVVLFEDANNDGAVFSSEVLQRNLYYPFGLELNGEWNSATSPRMDYLYNGKEFNEELELNWLDYGFRWYDAAVGRFPSVDPLADRGPQWSPYVYTFNNPIRYTDPDGRWPIETIWDIGNVIYDVGAAIVDHVRGDHAAARGHWGDLGMDAGAMLIPYVPAGASKLRHADDVVEAALKHGGDAKKAAKIDMAKESGEFAKIGSTGKVGENYLKGLGGDSQKYFATKAGKGGRYVDQFVDGVAHEAKTGYTTLTKEIQQQIAKDAELLANPNSGVKKVVWNFFESPTTGKAGASKPLLEALQKAGIETTIIK
jgi:RHS repeat-associated protein